MLVESGESLFLIFWAGW